MLAHKITKTGINNKKRASYSVNNLAYNIGGTERNIQDVVNMRAFPCDHRQHMKA